MLSHARHALRRLRGLGPPAPHTLAFIHIPKTGGISLREHLLVRTGRRPSFRIIRPSDDIAALRALPAARRARLALVEGHMYYGVHELLPRPCVYLTMLREPVERVLSYYSFIREWPHHHLHHRVKRDALSLGDCLRLGLTVELDNFMVRTLTSLDNLHVPFGAVTRAMLDEATSHLGSIPLLGLTERYEASLSLIFRTMGWGQPTPGATRLNTTTSRLKRQQLTPSELGAIQDHNALDAELYRHAERLFLARAADRATTPIRANSPYHAAP